MLRGELRNLRRSATDAHLRRCRRRRDESRRGVAESGPLGRRLLRRGLLRRRSAETRGRPVAELGRLGSSSCLLRGHH